MQSVTSMTHLGVCGKMQMTLPAARDAHIWGGELPARRLTVILCVLSRAAGDWAQQEHEHAARHRTESAISLPDWNSVTAWVAVELHPAQVTGLEAAGGWLVAGLHETILLYGSTSLSLLRSWLRSSMSVSLSPYLFLSLSVF